MGEGGPVSDELSTLALIDRFGVRAVLGDRVLHTGEMLRMLRAETIVKAYREREQAPNWAEWAQRNANVSTILNAAMKAAEDGE